MSEVKRFHSYWGFHTLSQWHRVWFPAHKQLRTVISILEIRLISKQSDTPKGFCRIAHLDSATVGRAVNVGVLPPYPVFSPIKITQG